MQFRDIPFHTEIKQRLIDMAQSDRVPHALLLEGPEGTAKFALARAFAQYLHCERRGEKDSCGECPSCRQFKAFNHVDTMYSFPVIKAKSGRPTISDDYRTEFIEFVGKNPWMDFQEWLKALGTPNTLPTIYVDEGAELMRRLSYTSHVSKYKTVLMWLPERMKEEMANKILKLVEEPTRDSVFIMTSDAPTEILPTIYSRVQRIKVPRYSEEEVTQFLHAKGVDSSAAADAAALSEGNLNMALHYSAQNPEMSKHFERFKSLMRLSYLKDLGGLKKWSEEVAGLKREQQLHFLNYCSRLLRENYIFNIHDHNLLRLTAAEKEFSKNFSPFVNERNVVDLMQIFTDAARDITGNANSKIVIFDACLQVFMVLRR